MVKKFRIMLMISPLTALADVVDYVPQEYYFWSTGEYEVRCVLLASVAVGVCIVVSVWKKWHWKKLVGTILGVVVLAVMAFMSICHSCGGRGRSYDGRDMIAKCVAGKVCNCCQGRGFHLPWNRGCVANPQCGRYREIRPPTQCPDCGTKLRYEQGRYCPKCNPRHSGDNYFMSGHETIGTE